MKKIIMYKVIAISILVLGLIIPNFSLATEQKIEIIDNNLYISLKEILNDIADFEDNTKTITISEEKIREITTLDLSDNKIENIDGLEKFTNLQKLDVSSNNISKIDKNIPSLLEINLSLNYMENLNSEFGIDKLTNLKKLNVSRNQLTDENVFINLPNLEELNIEWNSLNTVNSIKNLTNLKVLNMSLNNIKDLKQFECFNNLTILDLSSNKILNITEKVNMPNLKTLDLSLNDDDSLGSVNLTNEHYLTDITGLSGLASIEKLDLSINGIKNIDVLSKLKNLKNVDLSMNRISEIKEPIVLENLEEMNLSSNKLINIEGLDTIKNSQLYIGEQVITVYVDNINNTTIKLPPIYSQIKNRKMEKTNFYAEVDKVGSGLGNLINPYNTKNWPVKINKDMELEVELNLETAGDRQITIIADTPFGSPFFNVRYIIKYTVPKDKVKEKENIVLVNGVKIDNKQTIQLKVNDTYKFNATVSPETATNKNIIWKTLNEDIVDIDEKGRILAKKAGEATIYVMSEEGAYLDYIVIKVYDDESYLTKEEDGVTYITNILETKNTLAQVAQKFANQKIEARDANGNELSEDSLLGTGSQIDILNDKNEVINSYVVIIYGDTTGDGKINAIDALAIVKNKSGKIPFESKVFTKAGMILSDSEIPTAIDALAIIKHKNGKYQIEQGR